MLRVRLKAGAWVEPARMLESIRDAGFTPVPEAVRFTVTGKLVKRETHLLVELDGMATPRTLGLVAGGSDAPTQTVLETYIGKVVELEGRWLEGGEARLEVTALRPAQRLQDRRGPP